MIKGSLIVFTGIDGSGKSTQAELLIEYFKKEGMEVSYIYNRWNQLFFRWLKNIWKSSVKKKAVKSDADFDSVKKRARRKLLDNPIFRRSWLLYFFIDYGLQLFVKVRLRLLRKQVIVSDRIFYDSIIDQAVDLGNRKDWLLDSLDSFWAKVLFPVPDLVIFVDCPAAVAFSRKDDIPDIDYLSERRELYIKMVDKYHWLKVDGTLPVEEIAAQIKNEVHRKLGI